MQYFVTKKEAIKSLKNPKKVRFIIWNKSRKKWAAAERMNKDIKRFYMYSPYEQPKPKTINYIELYDYEMK